MTYKLTVMIPTLVNRVSSLKALVEELQFQSQGKPVQILWIGDNKSMTVGEKRNHLKYLAKGDFISFVDDDDTVSFNYISTILRAIDQNQDKTVICFKGTQNTNGLKDCPFKYDVNYGRNHKQDIDGVRWKVMIPDHLCVWNRSKITEDFPNKNLSEDHDWAKAMAFKYNDRDQVLLDDTLYHYEFSKDRSECRK